MRRYLPQLVAVTALALSAGHVHARPKPSFASTSGWRTVPCGIELAAADRALTRAKIRFKKEASMRGHFPAGPGGGGGGCVQFDRRAVEATPWKGQLEFRWGRLHSLHLVRATKTPGEVATVMAALKARHGKPKLYQPLPARPHYHLMADWSNRRVQLSLRVTLYKGTYRVAQHWQRLPWRGP